MAIGIGPYMEVACFNMLPCRLDEALSNCTLEGLSTYFRDSNTDMIGTGTVPWSVQPLHIYKSRCSTAAFASALATVASQNLENAKPWSTARGHILLHPQNLHSKWQGGTEYVRINHWKYQKYTSNILDSALPFRTRMWLDAPHQQASHWALMAESLFSRNTRRSSTTTPFMIDTQRLYIWEITVLVIFESMFHQIPLLVPCNLRSAHHKQHYIKENQLRGTPCCTALESQFQTSTCSFLSKNLPFNSWQLLHCMLDWPPVTQIQILLSSTLEHRTTVGSSERGSDSIPYQTHNIHSEYNSRHPQNYTPDRPALYWHIGLLWLLCLRRRSITISGTLVFPKSFGLNEYLSMLLWGRQSIGWWGCALVTRVMWRVNQLQTAFQHSRFQSVGTE